MNLVTSMRYVRFLLNREWLLNHIICLWNIYTQDKNNPTRKIEDKRNISLKS